MYNRENRNGEHISHNGGSNKIKDYHKHIELQSEIKFCGKVAVDVETDGLADE